MTKLLVSLAFTISLSSGQQFEAVSVKHYDHKNDRNTPWGPRPVFGCHLGPGQLQYNCTGPVSRLAAEALNLQNFQYDEQQQAAEYALTAKIAKPVKRFQINAMLADFLKNEMGVQYHFEKRPVKGEFLTVVDKELLKKLPESHEDIPLADVSKAGGRDERYRDFVERKITGEEEQLTCKNITFDLLVQMLQLYYIRVPIINDTGLDRRFDITLVIHWWGGDEPPQLSDQKKALAQYGLAFQVRTGPVDYLVIDGVAPESKFMN